VRHGRVQRLAVRLVRVPVPIHVRVADVPDPVRVEILLAGIRDSGAVVRVVVEPVAVLVRIADVPDPVEVQVLLQWIEGPRAVVVLVHDPVGIPVVLAGIPDPVVVRIGLIRVRNPRAVVHDGRLRAPPRLVRKPVAVRIAVARIPGAVAVQVRLVAVRDERAVVLLIRDPVVVVIRVAEVPEFVVVVVLLIRIRGRRAVVHDVQDAVPVQVLVARVADLVAIQVRLVRIRRERAVVLSIRHGIVVVVRVADIPEPVRVVVLLVRVLHERTVVRHVRHPVVVVVVIARIAEQVFRVVVVLLIRIRDRWAVVLLVRDPVPVEVRVHTVRDPVLVRVREPLVGLAVAVVVQAIADLRGRIRPLADLLSARAQRLPFAGPVTVGQRARPRGDAVVHLAVAVVVHEVAGLLLWRLCIALGIAGPLSAADSELVLEIAVRHVPALRILVGARALGASGRPALLHERPAGQRRHALEVLRAVRVRRALDPAELPLRAVFDAQVLLVLRADRRDAFLIGPARLAEPLERRYAAIHRVPAERTADRARPSLRAVPLLDALVRALLAEHRLDTETAEAFLVLLARTVEIPRALEHDLLSAGPVVGDRVRAVGPLRQPARIFEGRLVVLLDPGVHNVPAIHRHIARIRSPPVARRRSTASAAADRDRRNPERRPQNRSSRLHRGPPPGVPVFRTKIRNLRHYSEMAAR